MKHCAVTWQRLIGPGVIGVKKRVHLRHDKALGPKHVANREEQQLLGRGARQPGCNLRQEAARPTPIHPVVIKWRHKAHIVALDLAQGRRKPRLVAHQDRHQEPVPHIARERCADGFFLVNVAPDIPVIGLTV